MKGRLWTSCSIHGPSEGGVCQLCVDTNGNSIASLKAKLADLREQHEAFVRAVREIAERAVIRHADGLGEASGTIAIIAAICDAELGKEVK